MCCQMRECMRFWGKDTDSAAFMQGGCGDHCLGWHSSHSAVTEFSAHRACWHR